MNLEELRRIRDTERSKDSLQHLRDEFYSEVGTYLEELRSQRDEAAEAADDPFSDPDVQRLSDEVSTAERTVEALYERRVGKIVKLASFAAADMSAEREGLTAEEQELFDAIVSRIKENRETVLATIAGKDMGDEPTAESDAFSRGAEPTDRTSAEHDGAEQPPDETAEADQDDDPDRTTVRITSDVGEIVGIDDRAYDLSADDIISLPTKNAEPLLDRGAAERVE